MWHVRTKVTEIKKIPKSSAFTVLSYNWSFHDGVLLTIEQKKDACCITRDLHSWKGRIPMKQQFAYPQPTEKKRKGKNQYLLKRQLKCYRPAAKRNLQGNRLVWLHQQVSWGNIPTPSLSYCSPFPPATSPFQELRAFGGGRDAQRSAVHSVLLISARQLRTMAVRLHVPM